MNIPTILAPTNWTTVAKTNNVKDTRLQQALADYKKLDASNHDELADAIEEVIQFATALQKAKETVSIPALVKHLKEMIAAAEAQRREIAKAKAEAEKAIKAKAEAEKKAGAEAKKREQEEQEAPQDGEDEEEDEAEDSAQKLKRMLQSLKTSKVPYHFIACDAKPYGLVVAKKNIKSSAQHKKELAKVAGGSTRPPKFGMCIRDGNNLIFEMEKPAPGLARVLQKWLKVNIGIPFKVTVGDESAEDEGDPLMNAINPDIKGGAPPEQQEAARQAPGPLGLTATVGRGGKNKLEDVQAVQEALNRRVQAGLPVDGKCDSKTIAAIEEFQKRLGQFKPDGLIEPQRGTARALASTATLGPPPPPPKPLPPPKLGKATLAKAPAVWHGTRNILETNINELKKGVRGHYGSEHPDLLKQIEESMVKLGGILDKLDDRLAHSLEKANAAANEAARKAELKNAKTILTDYIKYVKTEPLIAHMDSNPFGVQTSLKKVLTDSLTHMAQAIG
jgi:hypothetical protein